MAKDDAEGMLFQIVVLVIILGIFAISIQLLPLIYDFETLEGANNTVGTFEIDEDSIEATQENFEEFAETATKGLKWQVLQGWLVTAGLLVFAAFAVFFIAGIVGKKMRTL